MKKIDLPQKLVETSGLIYFNGLVWTFNDSGGESEIYSYSMISNKIEHKVNLWNTNNYDWEEISQDSTHIYIGDFGNNFGTRKYMYIYKIDKKDITYNRKNSLATAKAIRFTYPDYHRVLFSMKIRSAFDCEAMIWHDGSIYIFTKNWVNQTSTIYRLPDNPGHYLAEKIGEFDSKGLITAASYHHGCLYLLGYYNYTPFLWIFPHTSNFALNTKNGVRYDLKPLQGEQTEGIAVIDSSTVLISAEKTKDYPHLFVIKLTR
ncbi:MAG: hypothetical protein Q8928_03960 [Bacteroidota bacterium]|nr:hypothetical protein [Bacteroidota bacterium]